MNSTKYNVVKQQKIDQFKSWVETILKDNEQLPLDYNYVPFRTASNIYNSDSKVDLLELISWLDDPKNN